jgi:hypothetical protein
MRAPFYRAGGRSDKAAVTRIGEGRRCGAAVGRGERNYLGPVWFLGYPLIRLPEANLSLFGWLNKPPSQAPACHLGGLSLALEKRTSWLFYGARLWLASVLSRLTSLWWDPPVLLLRSPLVLRGRAISGGPPRSPLPDSAELPSAANTRENNDKHSGYTFPRVDTRGQTLGGVRSGN